jgi:hypothetical protein
MVCGSVYVWELGGAEALSNDGHTPPTTCLPVSMYTNQGANWDIHSDDGFSLLTERAQQAVQLRLEANLIYHALTINVQVSLMTTKRTNWQIYEVLQKR